MITFKKQIVEPARLSAKRQAAIKAGVPWAVLVGQDDKKGKLWTKDGWIIWDGKNFTFIPWRKNSKYAKKEAK